MKPIIKKLWIVVAMLCISVSASAYDFYADGIYYTKLSDGFSVEVSNKSTSTFAKSTYSGNVVIPESVMHNGLQYNVTSIGEFAFYSSGVTSVELPDGIVSIGRFSFAKSASMAKCPLPETITSIGEGAFSECVSLQKINIPKGVSTLNLEIFYRCYSITEVTIPNTVMHIAYSSRTWASSGSGALSAQGSFPCFAECTALKTVIFEDGDRPISFYDAYPGAATSGGEIYDIGIFYRCPIKSLYLGRTLEDSKKGLFQSISTLTNVEIGPLVKGIQSYAFQDCQGIETITIPSTITKIGVYSFYKCSKLTRAFIGDGLNVLTQGAFANCTNLEEVYIGNGIKNIGSEAFHLCTNLKTVVLCSPQIESMQYSNINSPYVKFYVPQKELYDIVLNGFQVGNIGTISGGDFEYTGSTPQLKIVPSISTINLSVSAVPSIANAGNYSEEIPIGITFPAKWSSSFKQKADFSISKALLTVIANDASRKYGMENPELTCSFFGFKNGETKDVLTRLPNIETTATISSNVGAYPIIPNGAEAQNYTFNYERGTLTISKADQTIEWEQQFGEVKVGDVIELTAISSVGLPIKYISTDETIADIFTKEGKKYVEFLKPGNVSIRATQQGNENYNEADRVSKSINVGVLISAISLNQNSATLTVGNSLQLTASVTPADASVSTLIWESANPEIATVDDKGKVSALKPGSTIITVKSTDGSNLSAQCELTVVKLVEGITLNVTSSTLAEGQSLQLYATVSTESATNKTIEWGSSNDAVATVTKEGKVTAISKGTAIITATSIDGSDVSASCSVEVVKLVSGIELSETELTLNEGQSATLTANVTPELANNKSLVWSSSNESVATVDQDGKVTAISKGVAAITAKSTDGSNISADCTVNVVRLVSGIVLNETDITLSEGTTTQLTAIFSADANDKSLVWISSNVEVATVSQDGLVTAVSKGTAVITAKATDGSNVSATCSVEVVKLVSGIELSERELTLSEGQSATLTANVTPELANNKSLIWSSSNESVATVDQDGKVTAISKGVAIITAKSTDGSNISAICAVTVVKLVSGIVLNETELTLNEGQSAILTATVTPELANDKSLEWSSSNKSVATVDQDGKITAISKGVAIITAKSTDGSNISATCAVTVVKLVSGIVLNETELTLSEGQSATLTANVISELANNKTLEWSSSNEAVATVDQDGKVIAISKGVAIITAKSTDGSNISADCMVNVVRLVSSIVLNETDVTLNEGATSRLTAIVSDDANDRSIVWISSNVDVATVSQDGLVTAVSKGTAVITAKATDGSNVSASCSVEVVKLVSGIELSETELTLSEGQSATLTANVTPELANNKSLIWSSSNESVAIVDQDGKVTAISKGVAIITAKSTDGSNISATCAVTVVKLVSGIVLNETELTLNEGQSAMITATVTPELANNKSLAWSSSNEAVATVDKDGKVTAISKGGAVITAKATDGSNVSASCSVEVVKLVSGIELSETELTLSEGQSATLTATVIPELANNKSLVWSSSDESVAIVYQDGKVTAISKGVAIITAKTTDGSNIWVDCRVNVVKLVSSIYVSEKKITMKLGEQKTINAYAIPDAATNPSLRWYSEDDRIATVEDGVVTAVGVGSTNIFVESTDGSNIVKKCEIEVIESAGIDQIVSSEPVNVYTANGVINIANVPANDTAYIFHTNGTLLKSEYSTGGIITFQPSAKGVYIVVVDSHSYKVVIR